MEDSELDKWMNLTIEDIKKMNMISQMEYNAKQYQLNQEEFKHNQSLSRHIIYAAIISGVIIALGSIIAVVIGKAI